MRFVESNSVFGDRKKIKLKILKTILLGIICLSVFAVVVNIFSEGNDLIGEVLPSIILVFFWINYIFAIKGFLKVPSVVVVCLLSFSAYYLELHFGTVIPHSWILLALSIIIGGILITSKFVLLLTIIHTVVIVLFTYLQEFNYIKYELWSIKPTLGSILITILVLIIIAIVTWISNSEIEKALDRARQSDKALRKERDNLEKEVERRTKELKKAQLEKIINLYRFADFGRLTAGLFHDISNPLTQVSLNLDNIEHQSRSKLFPKYKKINPIIKRAMDGTKQMENLVLSVRNQIQQQETKSVYHPSDEIKTSLDNLQYKATSHQVSFVFKPNRQITTFGNPIRFFQLVSNLISNAIDAYYEVKRKENRKIIINFKKYGKYIILTVQDFGCGINPKIINKIFNPLFTTKGSDKGTGVGLYISRDIVEKELLGSIKVKSKIDQGTTFFIKFPINKNHESKKSS